MRNQIIFLILILNFTQILTQNLAIIGTGVAGATAGHYLHKQFEGINITYFEKEQKLGGRTHTTKLVGELQELGATFIINENLNIKNLMKEMDLHFKEEEPITFAIVREGEPKFIGSENKYITLGKMIYRYGWRFLNFIYQQSQYIQQFLTIYDFQDQGKIFENYEEFMEITVGYKEVLQKTAQEVFLTDLGANQLFAEEMLNGVISDFYNQNYDVNGFAGHIAAAGFMGEPRLLKEGMKSIPESLISNMQSKYGTKVQTSAQVSKILYDENTKKYTLVYHNPKSGIETEETFDQVIIGAPIPMTNIKFSNNIKYNQIERKTVPIYKYAVASKSINSKPFGFSTEAEMPKVVMSPDRVLGKISIYQKKCEKCYKNSKGQYVNVYVWTGRNGAITDEEFDKLFPNGYEILIDHTNEWPYPDLADTRNKQTSQIRLNEGLYYINGMEFISSCMEMESISSRNVVNHIRKFEGKSWKSKTQENQDQKPEL